MQPNKSVEEIVKEFREKYKDLEKDAREFLEYKCNQEQKTRYVVVKEYGLKGFEDFLRQALTSHTNPVLQGVVDIVDDNCTWYNTNNQIPNSELGKSDEHWEMLQKLVRDSLKDVGERIKKDVLSLLNDQIISNEEKK